MNEKLHASRRPDIVADRVLYCVTHGNTEHRNYETIGYGGVKTTSWRCVECLRERDRRRKEPGYVPAYKMSGPKDPLPPVKNICPNCFLETPAGAPCQHCY